MDSTKGELIQAFICINLDYGLQLIKTTKQFIVVDSWCHSNQLITSKYSSLWTANFLVEPVNDC